MDYWLSNDTILATIEAISKIGMLIYLNTELPIYKYTYT